MYPKVCVSRQLEIYTVFLKPVKISLLNLINVLYECGYKNTPWDLKFFYKWKNDKPMLLIVHSDDFRLFGDKEQMDEWKLLVDTFEQHKYKVSDVTDSEFVGIRITRDEQYNYYMDQTRMVEEIVNEAQLSQAKDKKLP